ncbi:hypothetical protein EXE51_15785 [Halorubrum sp. CGM5_25_10-8B]|uniref:hypothetical protein n=1 Tax=Halorubrum sp. CGM5_25_10-8B TaxID=2518115 RepID=UPI0010F6059B|nr:hypothetical protein [Halorubrum sp. CGM5_25_10-8B]TKX35134.1 hypothetical protein EXE51_15785 [Halorubrum sp. CGM5_25_10-8B]
MIGSLLDFLSALDLLTAIISVILGFILKMVWDVVSFRLRRRRQSIRDDIKWFRELRTLARQIVIATRVTRSNSNVTEDAGDEFLDLIEGNEDVELDEEMREVVTEFVQEAKDSALERQEMRMESLYEELLTHVATRDIELEDGELDYVLDLLHFTHLMPLNSVELSNKEKTPAEETGKRVTVICELRIEDLESDLSLWRSIVSRIK